MSESLTVTQPAPLGQSEQSSAAAVAIYLAKQSSRRTMAQKLARVSDVMADRPPAEDHAENLRRAYGARWSDLRADHVETIKAKLVQAGFKVRTINAMLAAVRGVLKICRQKRLIDAEDYRDILDVQGVKMHAGEPLKGRALSEQDFIKLAKAMDSDESPAGRRDAAILALGYVGAMRRGEIPSLDVGDWYAEENRIHIRKGKGRKERYVYLSDSAARAFTSWLDVRGTSDKGAPLFVAVNKSGKVGTRRLTDQAVYSAINKRRIEAGIEKFTPHDLRRTAIGDLLDAGVDIATAAGIAGHANVATTQAYDRRGERAKKKAASELKLPF